MEENKEETSRTYRRSTRHVKKRFQSAESQAQQGENYDENYRFDRENYVHTTRSHRKINSRPRQDERFATEDEDTTGSSYVRSSFFSNSFSHLQLFIASLILSLSFYSFPLFGRVATGSAANTLYAGFAMNHGVTPYNEIFGSSGPLFYLLSQVGAATGSTFILWLSEVIALWLAGVMAFEILQEMLANKSLSLIIALATQLAIAGISLGGDQAIIFALPFALYGVRVLNRYFVDDEAAKDEVFILFGIAGGLASLFFPLFLVIWLLGTLGLFGRNISLGNIGRGFYQLLAGLFGILAVFSVVGYYTLTTQIFYPAIRQAVILPFSHLNLSLAGLMNLLISLGLILLFGLLMSFFNGFYYLSNGNHRVWTAALLITGALSLLLISLSSAYTAADSLVILPFVFMYMGLRVDREFSEGDEGLGRSLAKYLQLSLALPIFALIFWLAFPIANQLMNGSYISSEKTIASYIDKNSSSSDQVIVLARSLEINRLAKRSSDISLPPAYYPASYLQALDIDISSSKSKFIVVDDGVSLSTSIKTILTSNYTTVKLTADHFKVYQIK